jgi:hypothetical protein
MICPLDNPANFLERFFCFVTGSDRCVCAGIRTKLLLYVASIGPVGIIFRCPMGFWAGHVSDGPGAARGMSVWAGHVRLFVCIYIRHPASEHTHAFTYLI